MQLHLLDPAKADRTKWTTGAVGPGIYRSEAHPRASGVMVHTAAYMRVRVCARLRAFVRPGLLPPNTLSLCPPALPEGAPPSDRCLCVCTWSPPCHALSPTGILGTNYAALFGFIWLPIEQRGCAKNTWKYLNLNQDSLLAVVISLNITIPSKFSSIW